MEIIKINLLTNILFSLHAISLFAKMFKQRKLKCKQCPIRESKQKHIKSLSIRNLLLKWLHLIMIIYYSILLKPNQMLFQNHKRHLLVFMKKLTQQESQMLLICSKTDFRILPSKAILNNAIIHLLQF